MFKRDIPLVDTITVSTIGYPIASCFGTSVWGTGSGKIAYHDNEKYASCKFTAQALSARGECCYSLSGHIVSKWIYTNKLVKVYDFGTDCDAESISAGDNYIWVSGPKVTKGYDREGGERVKFNGKEAREYREGCTFRRGKQVYFRDIRTKDDISLMQGTRSYCFGEYRNAWVWDDKVWEGDIRMKSPRVLCDFPVSVDQMAFVSHSVVVAYKGYVHTISTDEHTRALVNAASFSATGYREADLLIVGFDPYKIPPRNEGS